jgi:hypothetical protein
MAKVVCVLYDDPVGYPKSYAIYFGLQMQFAMNVTDTDRAINRPEVA